MNTKGFLLGEETLKIIIAVIAISFLIYLLFSLYYANKSSKNLELAKASLERLIKEINAGSTEVEIYNPKGWGITSYEGGVEKIPNFCSNLGWNNCVCMCGPLGGSVKTAKVACLSIDKKGIVCKENNYFVFGGNINIEPPLILSIGHENKIIQEEG